MLGSTLCLSLSSSACLLAESRARTAGQGLGPLFVSHPNSALLFDKLRVRTATQGFGLSFASVHLAQRVSSQSRVLVTPDKAWIHTFTLSTRLRVSHRRVMGGHLRTMLGSMLRLSQLGSACLLADLRPRTAGQIFGLRFISLQPAQRVSLPSS